MAAHIIKENPKAIYNHCKLQSVANIIKQIKELSYFFNFSEPRQLLLQKCIELHAPDADKKN